MKSHAHCARQYASAPWPTRTAARDAFHFVLADIAERCGQFLPPFERYQRQRAAFSCEKRFLLNLAIAGDTHAIAARDAQVALARSPLHVTAPELHAAVHRFIEVHQPDWSRYFQHWTPARARTVIDISEAIQHPHLREFLALAVATHLGPLRFRGLARHFRSDFFHHPLILKPEFSNSGMRMELVFEFPCFGLRISPAHAFFFSGVHVDCMPSEAPDIQIEQVFSAIGETLPTFIVEIDRGLRAAERAFEEHRAV